MLRPDKFTVGCVSYFTALRAARVPAELHVYGSGGHGGCFDKYPLPDWGRQAARFLRTHKHLDAAAEAAGNDWLAKQEPGVRASAFGHIDTVGGPKAPPRRPAAGKPSPDVTYAVWPEVDRATLAVRRAEKPDGRSVVVVGEPDDAAAGALTRRGVTVFVLRCREAATLADVQRAVSLVRSRAAEFGVDPEWVGVLGVAAGAHPAAARGHRFGERSYPAADAHDRASCRAAFVALVAPAGLAAADGTVVKELTGARPPSCCSTWPGGSPATSSTAIASPASSAPPSPPGRSPPPASGP